MKNIYQLVLTLFLGLSTQATLQAAHIIGGEMTYVCNGADPNISGNQLYTFTMKVYRDCAGTGAQFDSAPGAFTSGTISVFQGDATVEFLNLILDPPIVTNIPNGEDNPCVIIPPGVCGQEGVYTFIASLPIVDETYHIVYQRCCRNNTITNIVNPGEAGATYNVDITPFAQTQCNSSPIFNNLPETVLCINQPLNINSSAFDADGDQLVYSFCSPINGGSIDNVAPNPDTPPPFDDIEFLLASNYSSLEPLGGSPVVGIDPFTGLITGTVTEQGQFVVGICVEEYRNGELLSTIQRDYQFNVAFCEELVNADIEGVAAGEAFIYESCVDSTIAFVNESTDEQYITSYDWTFNIPGNQALSFDTRDITVTFPGPGYYTGSMIVNPGTQCSDTAEIIINITEPIFPNFEFEYDTCVAGPVDFMDRTTITNQGIEFWEWDFGDGNVSNEVNPSHMYEDPGDFPVSLSVTDTIGCIESVTIPVNWFPAPPIIVVEPSTFVGCPPADVDFINLSSPIDSTYDVIWSFGDGGSDDAISPTYNYEAPGIFDVGIQITSPIGCTIERSFSNWISMDSLPVADFDFPLRQYSNFEPEISFMDQSTRAVFWEWQFDQYGSTIEQNPTFVFPDTGMMEVELVITHRFGCQDSITKIVDIEPLITYFLPNAFTPNEDGLNEFFRGGGYFRGIRDFDIKIMNRWGGLVFESQDPAQGWNGREKNAGQMSQTGVYPVYVRFTGPRGQPHEYKGFATLIR